MFSTVKSVGVGEKSSLFIRYRQMSFCVDYLMAFTVWRGDAADLLTFYSLVV